jgi:hypothetical protein
MHSSVLQNKKYIKFAFENTVEVISVDRLEEGIQKNDPKAGTYKEKDENGKEVEYLVSWPGLTLEDMKSLRSSKASSYNDTGKIPYIAIVNPYTLEKFSGWNGGSLKQIISEVEKAQDILTKEHGKPVSRKLLVKVRKEEEKVRERLGAGDLGKAWVLCAGFDKQFEGKGAAIDTIGAKLKADLVEATTKKLDELDALVARGETKAAEKELRSFIRHLKGTPLEQRANDLMAKINPPDA